MYMYMYMYNPHVQSHLWSVAWQPSFDKQIPSQERGGGVRGVEQWIQMATDYNYYVQPVQVPLQCTYRPSLTQIVQEGIDVVLQGLEAQEEVKVHGTWVT